MYGLTPICYTNSARAPHGPPLLVLCKVCVGTHGTEQNGAEQPRRSAGHMPQLYSISFSVHHLPPPPPQYYCNAHPLSIINRPPEQEDCEQIEDLTVFTGPCSTIPLTDFSLFLWTSDIDDQL